MSSKTKLNYRPDIDGLRAIAVLSVIAFHMSKSTLPGGYLGVDMFFCLSGYLISSIVWREIGTESFSLSGFYERRVRRIAPALIALLVITTSAALILLLPADLIGYSKSLVASLLFVANIYFWRDTDYFARSAEEKPLLHLWSLGVEEQFYIFFPLLLLLLRRWLPRGAFATIAVLAIASLILNTLAIRFNGSAPAFFLLPTRIWELGVGALIAVSKRQMLAAGLSANLSSVIAAALIAYGLTSGGELIAGVLPAALPVVFGTALATISGPRSVFNRLLATKAMVGVGLISYSLYLWHWPILVFARYYLVRDLTPTELTAAFAPMLALAYLSWRYIERPFRQKIMPVRMVYAVSATAAALLAASGIALIAARGLPTRLPAKVAAINAAIGTHYRCSVSQLRPFGGSRACVLSPRSGRIADARVVLLGNSFAQMYAPIVREMLRRAGQPGILVPANGCLPTPDLNLSPECATIAAANLEAIEALPRAELVILALTYHDVALVYPAGTPPDDRLSALASALDRLIDRLQRQGKRVALVGPLAIPGYDIASDVSRRLAFGWPVNSPLYQPEPAYRATYGALIAHFDRRRDIAFLRPDRVQCESGRCAFIRGDRSLFADNAHLAAAALPQFAPMFEAALSEEIARLPASRARER